MEVCREAEQHCLNTTFDGDMTSLTVAYSDDAMKESERHFASKKGYVGTDGRFLMDNNIDTIKYVLFNLTGDPKPAN
jgi:hypothetical protein